MPDSFPQTNTRNSSSQLCTKLNTHVLLTAAMSTMCQHQTEKYTTEFNCIFNVRGELSKPVRLSVCLVFLFSLCAPADEFSATGWDNIHLHHYSYMCGCGGRLQTLISPLGREGEGCTQVACQSRVPRDVALKARHLAGWCIPAVHTHTHTHGPLSMLLLCQQGHYPCTSNTTNPSPPGAN